MKKILFLVLFFSVSFAKAYTLVATSENSVDFFVDISSLQIKGNYVRAWEKTNLPSPKLIDGSYYQSTRSYEEYDCKERKSRTLSWSVFLEKDLKGGLVLSYSKAADWDFIAPNTTANKMMNVVCKK